MKSEDINKLIRSGSHPLCVSLILKTDRVNKTRNYEILKNALRKATALINRQDVSEEVRHLVQLQMDQAFAHVPKTIVEGLGIFISPADFTFVSLPFEVKQKIVVGDRFEVRDLLYLLEFGSRYCLLNLGKKGVHLYEGTLNSLEEVKDENFPLLYHDTFEYVRASRADSSNSSLKSFEREKNLILEIRLKAVFRDADVFVRKYLTGDTRLLVAGTQKMIALFGKVTSLKQHLAGKVSGSYTEKSIDHLQQVAWDTIIRIRSKDTTKQVEAIREKRNGHVAEGLRQAWAVAQKGKGQLLLVEKDFHRHAYRKAGESKLYFQPPAKPYQVIPDAVENLIDTVRTKNGRVMFTENGQLEEFGHLALVLRY